MSNSSRNGHNIPHPVDDSKDPVIFYEWRNYLQQYFKTLKHISDYHHFFVSAEEPGIVKCKESASSDTVTFNLLKSKSKCPKQGVLPTTTEIEGLDPARQWYLYEHIREHCYSETGKESTCPKPVVPKKEIDLTNKEDSIFKCKGGRKKALLN